MRIEPTGELRQRQPRERDEKHLAFIRRLPCSARVGPHFGPIHAAHIRSPSAAWQKRGVGFGEKPDDKWTVPLCASHHLVGQHAENELDWWMVKQGIDPFRLAFELWQASGDMESGWLIAEGKIASVIPF